MNVWKQGQSVVHNELASLGMLVKLPAAVSLQRFNTLLASIAYKYCKGQMKSTLVRELNESLKLDSLKVVQSSLAGQCPWGKWGSKLAKTVGRWQGTQCCLPPPAQL